MQGSIQWETQAWDLPLQNNPYLRAAQELPLLFPWCFPERPEELPVLRAGQNAYKFHMYLSFFFLTYIPLLLKKPQTQLTKKPQQTNNPKPYNKPPTKQQQQKKSPSKWTEKPQTVNTQKTNHLSLQKFPSGISLVPQENNKVDAQSVEILSSLCKVQSAINHSGQPQGERWWLVYLRSIPRKHHCGKLRSLEELRS